MLVIIPNGGIIMIIIKTGLKLNENSNVLQKSFVVDVCCVKQLVLMEKGYFKRLNA